MPRGWAAHGLRRVFRRAHRDCDPRGLPPGAMGARVRPSWPLPQGQAWGRGGGLWRAGEPISAPREIANNYLTKE